MAAYNYYQKPDLLGTGLASYRGVKQIQREGRADEERAEDRAIRAGDRIEDRKRRTALYDRADAEHAANQPLVEATRTDALAGIAEKPSLRAYEQRERQRKEASAPTAAQEQEATGLKLRSAKLGIATQQEAITTSQQKRRDEADAKRQRQELLGTYQRAALNVDAMMQPEVADTVLDTYTGFADFEEAREANDRPGMQAAHTRLQAAWPKVIPALDTLLQGEFKDRDNKLDTGETITSRRVRDIDTDEEGNYILTLDITAEKDGKKRFYRAPPTKDGKQWKGDPDHVLKLPAEQMQDYLSQAAAKALEAKQGTYTRAKLDEQFRLTAFGLGMKDDEIKTALGPKADAAKGGAEQQLIMFLGDGDKAKGLVEYKKFKSAGQNNDAVKTAAANYAKAATSGNLGTKTKSKEKEDGTKYTYWDHYQEAMTQLGSAAGAPTDTAEPAAVDDSAYQEARDAIASGANPAAVNKRLADMGLNPLD